MDSRGLQQETGGQRAYRQTPETMVNALKRLFSPTANWAAYTVLAFCIAASILFEYLLTHCFWQHSLDGTPCRLPHFEGFWSAGLVVLLALSWVPCFFFGKAETSRLILLCLVLELFYRIFLF